MVVPMKKPQVRYMVWQVDKQRTQAVLSAAKYVLDVCAGDFILGTREGVIAL